MTYVALVEAVALVALAYGMWNNHRLATVSERLRLDKLNAVGWPK